MIFIIDYGMGNLFSVEKALKTVGADTVTTSDPDLLKQADAIVLPGVGNFGEGAKKLKSSGLDQAIKDFTKSGKPLLGICLGMQLLMENSDEAPGENGLAIFKGKVVRFPNLGLKIPQIGWNSVKFTAKNKFTQNIADKSYFYFVHSYFVNPQDISIVLGETEYGILFPSIIGKENIIAAQFHPEKSQNVGLKLLENFVKETRK